MDLRLITQAGDLPGGGEAVPVAGDGERDLAIHKARAVGQTWLGANLLHWDRTDVVCTADAAELANVGPSTIRKWHSLGYLPNHQGRAGRYVVAFVLDCAAARRRERVA